MAAPYDWTPESVASGRQFGSKLLSQGVDASPVGHWTQALARVLQAGSGAAWTDQANSGERAGKQGVADTYKAGLEQGLPMKTMAAQLMGNPFGAEQGQALAKQAMTTAQSQGFQQSQQERQFKQQMEMQKASQGFQSGQQSNQFAQQERMARLQNELSERLANANSDRERKQLMDRAAALGLTPPTTTGTAPSAEAPTAAPATPAQPPVDPYERMLTPAKSPQQLEEERRRKAAQAMMVGDQKGAVKILNKEDELKEGQTKDALWAERMMRSEVALRGVERQYSGTAGQGSPSAKVNNFWPDSGIVANMTNSQSFREYQQTSREWIAALLRKDTGAAVTESEWKLYFPTYFPQPGDGPQVLEQKRAARMAAASALREASGPAFERMFPGSPKELRGQIQIQNQTPPRQGTPQAAPQAVSAPEGAVQMLRSNPDMAAAFDEKYGAGAAARVLGGR